ncbi:MAG: methyltransferase domain-containing protein [Sedimentisphaerales bacterium]|nr:methyltransferase domain-containing protein [Sedimentisphaerales bacterium]
MQDSRRVFDELGLKADDAFLDIGCGAGEYALHAARLVGDTGHVYALDKSPDLITGLKEVAAMEGVTNLTACVADATKPLPLRNGCIDVCLVATVLHIPEVAASTDCLFSEIRRVLKPGGYVGIIECSKKDLSFGPPEEMRLPPEDIDTMAARCGFHKVSEADLGFNYMVTVSIKERKSGRDDNTQYGEQHV